MKRNKRLLLKAAKRIEDIPESYDQSRFARPSDEAPCGTAGCLAGEIIIVSERSVKKGVQKLNLIMEHWEQSGRNATLADWPGTVAGELAGLSYEEQERLFISTTGGDWPTRFRRKSAQGRAKTAPQLLRYLADGGKV